MENRSYRKSNDDFSIIAIFFIADNVIKVLSNVKIKKTKTSV